MKNLPDDEMFNALENRLRNYSEEPDDEVWRKISLAHPGPSSPQWIAWTNRTAAILTLTALFFVLYYGSQDGRDANISLSHTLKSKSPAVSEAIRRIPPGVNNDSKKRDEPALNLPVNDKSNRLNASQPFRASKISTTQQDVNHIDNGSDVLAELAQSNSIVKPVAVRSQDSLQIEQAVVKDTLVRPLQKETPRKEKRKRQAVTFYTMVAPLLSYYRVSPLPNDDVVIDKLNSPSILSTDRLGISIEIGIQGKITKRLEYVAGISYFQQSQRIVYEQLTSDNIIVEEEADKSYMVRPGILRKSFEYDMRNIGVQGGLLYSLKQEGLVHKAGILIHYQKGLHKPSDGDVYDNSTSNYLSYQLIYRMEYNMRADLTFFVQPAYMHSFYTKESLQAPFELKQSRAGIGVGIVYSF